MKLIFDWVLKNAWNLFGMVGVVGTFYFSLIHIPDYVKDITTGKVNVVHESLVDDIQELLFYDKAVTIEDISSFIKGKELKQGVSYPYNPNELLIQIQERFMDNKFIPLDKRESLLKSINTIRNGYLPPRVEIDRRFNWSPILPWLFSGFGVLIASIGAVSIVRKLKSDKETEVDIVFGDTADNHHSVHTSAVLAYEYEKMVGNVLDELGILKVTEEKARDHGCDFLVDSNNGEFIVDVKRYNKLLGLSTAREFVHKVNKSGKGGILIVSSGVTIRTKQLIAEHNKISQNQKIYLIVADSKNSTKDKLKELFNEK